MRIWPLIFALAMIALLIWLTDAEATWVALRSADPAWLGAAAAALSVQTVLMALRWRWVAAGLGIPLPLKRAVGEYYLGQAVNVTLPGGVAGDASRAFRSRQAAGLKAGALAVVIERLIGQVFLALALLIGALLAWTSDADRVLPGIVLAVGLGVGFIALGLVWMRPKLAWMARLAAPLRQCLGTSGLLGPHLVLGVAIVALNLFGFWASAQATGTTLSLQDSLFLVPLILLAMLIPFSVAGWGWREGAAALLFPLAGASAAAGIATSILFGIILTLVSLPGLLWPSAATVSGRGLSGSGSR